MKWAHALCEGVIGARSGILSITDTQGPTGSVGATGTMAGDIADTVIASAPPRADQADREPSPELGGVDKRAFAIAAAAVAIVLAGFIIFTATHPDDQGHALEVDKIIKLAASFIAAISCFVFARRARSALRLAWMWIGAFATVWAAGEAVLVYYQFARNGPLPFPSPADLGFLASMPLVAIGVLFFPSEQKIGVSRARLPLDGAIVAGSLLIVSWTTALGTVYHSGSGTVFSQAVGLAYPISDVIVATVAISVLAEGCNRHRLALALVVAGLVCLTVTDSSLAYLAHTTGFRYLNLVDSGRVAGFFLIALAPLLPAQDTTTAADQAESTSLWRVALPYFFLAVAITAAAVKDAQSHHLDLFVVVAGICVVAAVLVRQVLTMVENLRLAGQMRQAVSTLRANQVELVHFALHDSLTGLPNRVLFGDRLEHALARRASPSRRVAVLLCDLDSFKDVNDTLGHSSGDEVLIASAERLSSCVRPADTVARIGGDEFAILLDEASSLDEVASVAARVCAAMRTPFTIAGRDFVVKASVGVAMASEEDTQSEKLLQDADVALYAVKDAGGDNYTFFEPRLGKAYVDRLGLQAELSTALDKGQLFVEYQPIVELVSGRTVGVEALLRWRHPRRGVMKPVDFLPVAESSGTVVQIGAWTIQEALSQLRFWRDSIPAAEALWTSVNVSARQLASGDLVAAVSKAIKTSGLEPAALHLGLTEGAVIDLVDWSTLVLADLKSLGTALEIDDFGTGYSSLAYLKQLPIDGVKIDRAFVEGLGTDRRDAVIVEAIVSLAHALHLKVGAEGVETSRQVEWLATLGCDYGQGYHWSAPLAPAEVEQWLSPTKTDMAREYTRVDP